MRKVLCRTAPIVLKTCSIGVLSSRVHEKINTPEAAPDHLDTRGFKLLHYCGKPNRTRVLAWTNKIKEGRALALSIVFMVAASVLDGFLTGILLKRVFPAPSGLDQ
ncbi:MAG: hypothetical protein KGM92_08205 [Acidobacteriota bacterium]|nr:hypothetical protein [Acidobacteriota bacterium]